MNTTSLGSQAEQLVSDHLQKQGHQILDKNWRRRSCEIDIVTKKGRITYFVEVKFRRNPDHGGGLEHITPTKLKQMRYAAQMWAAENDWQGDSRLLAVAVIYHDGIMDLTDIQEID